MSSPDAHLPCPDTPAGGITRRAALGLLGLTAACGFTPAYAPGGAGTKLQGRVRPRDPATPDDFAFTGRIAERLGPAGAGAMTLDYRLTLATAQQAMTAGGITTRVAVNGSATYRLTAGTRTLAEGQINAFSGYSSGGSTVATVAAESDARARLAAQLADEVVTRLLAVPIP